MTEWAELSCGFLGRAPDHVASSLLGQVIGIEVFRRHGAARAQALLDYFDYASRNDLYLSYVIINPQADRNKAWGEQEADLVAPHRRRGCRRHHRARRQDARHRRDHGERGAGRQSAAAASRAKRIWRSPSRCRSRRKASTPVAQILRGGSRLAARQPARPRASTRTTRWSGSRTSRCRGSASSSTATPICAAPSSTTRSATPSRTTRRRSG